MSISNSKCWIFFLANICFYIILCSILLLINIYIRDDIYDLRYIEDVRKLSSKSCKIFFQSQQVYTGSVVFDNYGCSFSFNLKLDSHLPLNYSSSSNINFLIKINDELTIDLCSEIFKRDNFPLILTLFLFVCCNIVIIFISTNLFILVLCKCVNTDIGRVLLLFNLLNVILSVVGFIFGVIGYTYFYERHGIPGKIADKCNLPTDNVIFIFINSYGLIFFNTIIIYILIKLNKK